MTSSTAMTSDFKTIYGDPELRDEFFLFLKNVYNIYPELAFHQLITETSERLDNDETIYIEIQRRLPAIKAFLSSVRYELPALFKQQKEIARESLEFLEKDQVINGYVEIGTVGRYTNALRKGAKIEGSIYLINDQAPSYSPADIIDRGQIRKLGRFIPLDDYGPIDNEVIPEKTIDLVTCYIGLHHSPLHKLDAFVRSIERILRPGGLFIVRDHEVNSPNMRSFVSLAHTVFNAGLGVSWTINEQELRHFTTTHELTTYLQARNFEPQGKGILQEGDPTQNTLMKFKKPVH